LTMSLEERRRRSQGIKEQVRENDIGAWIDAQLRDLEEARDRAGSTLSA
jgi:trehalose-6-phosphate synthase